MQGPKRRPTVERTSDLDKFDTLLMLATERTNRRKRFSNERNTYRHSSHSPQRKDVPLLLIEQQEFNHLSNARTQQVRFSTDTDSFSRSGLRIPHGEDDDPNAADVSSGSNSSTNRRFLPRISRL